MHANDLVIDERAHCHAVEGVTEGLPELDVVPAFALVVEAVDPRDGGTLEHS